MMGFFVHYNDVNKALLSSNYKLPINRLPQLTKKLISTVMTLSYYG